MSSDVAIRRIGAFSYELQFSDNKHKPVYIDFKPGDVTSSIDHNNEFFYNFASKIAQDIAADKNEAIYPLGDRTWEIVEEKKSSPFLHRVTNFVHAQGDDGLIRFTVRRSESERASSDLCSVHEDYQFGALLLAMKQEDDNQYNQTVLEPFNKKYRKTVQAEDCSREPGMLLCSKEERAAGIRAKQVCPKTTFEAQVRGSIFTSPFTNLSTIAFQRYETEFTGNDGFKPEDCKYCLQLDNGILHLLPNTGVSEKSCDVNQHTVKFFRDMIVHQYGQDKFDYICHFYDMDFEELIRSGKPLTPEHVYRMNMGLNNIEADDLQKFLVRLPAFMLLVDASFVEKGSMPLFDFLASLDECPLSISEVRGIAQAMQAKWGIDEPLTTKHLLRWLHPICSYENVKDMPPKKVTELMTVFTPHESERHRIFTGREIYFAMKSGYTTAGKEQYKPWIDQQQLLHVFPVIQSTANWRNYYEKLAHTVCKYHLFREHPHAGCKVGAIIPGPLNDRGEKRWYMVKQAVHNGYGKICYTLMPLGNDPTLPIIKLYRSTASAKYSVFGEKTKRADTNLLNKTGYEGKARTDHYENSLIHEHTIPIWVAYQTQAKNRLAQSSPIDAHSLKAVAAGLAKANQELAVAELDKHHVMRLREVVQNHDGIINTLYFLGKIDTSLYHTIRTKHYEQKFPATMSPSENEAYFAEEREDALALMDQLLKYKLELRREGKERSDLFSMQLDKEISLLNDDLMAHVITPLAEQKKQQCLNELQEKILNRALALQAEAFSAVMAGQLDQANALIVEWVAALEDYATEIGENADSKTPRSMAFVGHSLGGAYAQVFTCHHLINQHRIPCPNAKCLTMAFDATGIRKDDNEKFKQFVADHFPLLEDLNIAFEIYHQHETHDPVAAVGIHLGSANSPQEAAFLKEHVDFTSEVYDRLPDAKHPAIAQAQTAHATQFLGGTEGVDYQKRSFDPFDLGLMENCEHVQGIPPEQALAKGKDLRTNAWQFPFHPPWMNWFQSHRIVSNALRMVSGPTWIEQDPRMVPYLDKDGILVVNA